MKIWLCGYIASCLLVLALGCRANGFKSTFAKFLTPTGFVAVLTMCAIWPFGLFAFAHNAYEWLFEEIRSQFFSGRY